MNRATAFFLCISLLLPAAASGQLFNLPESIVYDPGLNRYIVSNYGDGNIVQVDSMGQQSYYSIFLEGHAIVGLYVYEDTLYVATNSGPYQGITAFELATAEFQYQIPILYNGLLNDIAHDEYGNLYVTDYWDSKIYKIDRSTRNWWLYQENNLYNPNGITSDPDNNRLLAIAVPGGNAPLLEINWDDSTVSTLLYTGLSGGDGIVFDSDGYLYISNWGTNSIYRWEPTLTQSPEVFSSGHNAPADIYYDAWNNLIAVPNFYANNIELVPVPPVGIKPNVQQYVPPELTLLSNYPNPFNQSTVVSYQLPVLNDVELSVFDVRGRLITTLVNGFRPAGQHEAIFDAVGLTSGIYIYKLLMSGSGATLTTVSRRMVLIK